VKVILYFLLIISTSVFGQMLDNRNGLAFTDKPFFDSEFIRINKVESLNGRFTYKKPGDIMRNTEYAYVYSFDSLGRLISTFETRKDDGTVDTTWNKYIYNNQNLVVEHKRGDGKGFTSTLYGYDGKYRVISESFVREYVDSLGVLQRTILNAETMKYEEYDGQVKKTVYNSYGLPYLQEFSFYNELGYLVERTERLMMTSRTSKITYEYNEKGLMSSIKTIVGDQEVPSEETKFLYDEHGNLQDKHYYRDGVFITEIEMLYNDRSMLLTYVLTRDVATNFIMILNFKEYDFF
jgi:hypothetical protein